MPETPVVGRLRATLGGFGFSARGTVTDKATAAAERIASLTLDSTEKSVTVADRQLSFRDLGVQAENEPSAKLMIIVDDEDTVCADFGLDKGALSERQARIHLLEVLKAREVRDQRRHELETRILSGAGGFLLGLLTHLLT